MLLTSDQRRFLAFFLKVDPRRVRARWLDENARSLGAVADHRNPPPGAVRVKVYATMTDGIEFRGADFAYCVLLVADLPALDSYWAEPLRSLSGPGRWIAKQMSEPAVTETFRTPDRPSPEAFKVAPITSAWLKSRAEREGRDKTAVILAALALYRAAVEGEQAV